MAATGPSLTPDVAEAIRGETIIAVNDAYKLLPDADVLFACDRQWWRIHGDCDGFRGEKWTTYGGQDDDKTDLADKLDLNVIRGKRQDCDSASFSRRTDLIHYGDNSGFMALNLAILFGADPIVLVGFNMQVVGRQRHFFGDHPSGLANRSNYAGYVRHFAAAATRLGASPRIINATPDSALTCFERMELTDALSANF